MGRRMGGWRVGQVTHIRVCESVKDCRGMDVADDSEGLGSHWISEIGRSRGEECGLVAKSGP